MDREGGQSRIITKIVGIKPEKSDDATKPTILHIVTETNTGPLVLRISQHVAIELTAILNSHPLTRGST
jgi:hypothetical protein